MTPRRRLQAPLLALALGLCQGCVGDEPVGPSSNRRPEIRSVTITPAVVQVGGQATIQVVAVDPDGDEIYYRYTAEGGVIQQNPGNRAQATYIQSGVERPNDEITVIVTDTRNASAHATRAVALQGNRPPRVEITGGNDCHPPCMANFTAQATDPDGDSMSYLWSGCASGTDRSATCTIRSLGTNTATVVVSDGRGGITQVSADAEGTNENPQVSGGRTLYGSSATFQVTFSDPDGDPLFCGWNGTCQCVGSEANSNLDCVVPAHVSLCVQVFSCTDNFGGRGSTIFQLVR